MVVFGIISYICKNGRIGFVIDKKRITHNRFAMKRFLLLVMTLVCASCHPDKEYSGYWYIKNNTSREDIRITPLESESPVPVAVGDSVCISQVKGPLGFMPDMLYVQMRELCGDSELVFSIVDARGDVLKCWQLKDLGSEPHHFFDPESWIDYPISEALEIYKRTWVYTLTDEDLQK